MEVDVNIDRLYQYIKSRAFGNISPPWSYEYSDAHSDGEIAFARELLRDFFDEEVTSSGG